MMKAGDLVIYKKMLRGLEVKIRAPQRQGDDFADASLKHDVVILILGELTRDQAVSAAYTGQTQADVEHGSPYRYDEKWLWCMTPTGVYAIREKSLEIVSSDDAYRSAS